MPLNPASISNIFSTTQRIGVELRGSPLLCRPTEFIGVEIELEQANLNVRGDRIRWPDTDPATRGLVEAHVDGSLRNGIELVFSQPLFGLQALAAIDYMFAIKQHNNLTDSVRTSTHIHVNYSDVTPDVVVRAAAINAIIEPYIVGTAGSHREANCYAVSMRGSDFLTNNRTEYAIQDFVIHQANSHRYLGFNMAALAKYGTIEYRYFGGLERDSVVALVNMLLEQKTVALSAVNVPYVLEQYPTIREFIFNTLPHAAAFLKLDSVSHEDDVAWRDEVLARLHGASVFSDAFSLYEGEHDYEEEPAEHTGSDEYTVHADDIPMPDDAIFSSRLVNRAGGALSSSYPEPIQVVPDSNFAEDVR